MASSLDTTAGGIARGLRSPYVPAVLRRLEAAGGYLAAVWPQLEPSVATSGFLGSALYMADMTLDGAEAVYKPVLDRGSLLAGAVSERELQQIAAVLDVFHWVQPQLLLLLAALAEAWERPSVGGEGRAEPRAPSEREVKHLATEIALAPQATAPLPEIGAALRLEEAPELYRAVAVWPGYLEAVWEELQHLVAYPEFRRRGRALYYYARSSSRFLARPLEASRKALRDSGIAESDVDAAREAIDGTLPGLATMMMHCAAMRVGLGITAREVVQQG